MFAIPPLQVLAVGVLLGMWAWCSRLDADSRVIVPPCRIESVQSLKTVRLKMGGALVGSVHQMEQMLTFLWMDC